MVLRLVQNDRLRLASSGSEVAGVHGVEHVVPTIQELARVNLFRAPPFVQCRREIPGAEIRDGEIVVSGAVGGIAIDELLVVRDGLIVIARYSAVEEPERAIFLALGHAVDDGECLLPQLARLFLPAEPRSRVRRAGVRPAEVRVEVDRAPVVREGLLVFGARRKVLSERVLARRIQRSCSERLALRLPDVLGSRVAKLPSHVLRQHRDCAEDLRLVPHSPADFGHDAPGRRRRARAPGRRSRVCRPKPILRAAA